MVSPMNEAMAGLSCGLSHSFQGTERFHAMEMGVEVRLKRRDGNRIAEIRLAISPSWLW